jgi:hypothetical protein
VKDFRESHHWPEGQQRAHWHLTFEGAHDVHRFVSAHEELIRS